ncbi:MULTISPECIES: maleylacetate reductase [Micrococcaceae]|uniref:Maleylacetate reductase n=4 Tax=Micrococcaceae TaxID=1268 RepID=A0ACC6TKE8_9MICC|nr:MULTISPECIES: maleylacetate reductase [Micrococcaceae]AAN08761.1 putative maleylacetate reductase [Pseudarthrobacter chlorophenolicus]ACL42516.1 iron-containing alcohol dehydrogenase [Pseudarthrobacter chlorophenolicus A6]ELT44212.1 iron-containing alcohol dehydrogenase [Arthrobacter nitrophenolicus]SDQ10388.1 maleylacetate reductase [Pseudarthrobacter chlorophenolicus]
MSLTFEHVTLGQRVLFGTGNAAANLAAEVARLGAQRVMVIASDFETDIARTVATGIEVALWHHDVVMHVPIETAEKARAAAAGHGIDLLVSVGGGSTTGLAKAVAMTTRIPVIAVPTTYAGSEATNVWGLTEASRKTTGVDDAVLPVTVIYDAALTLSLPVDMSVASGLNGMAHCIDSMWAPHMDPINAALSAEGIRALSSGLPLIVDDPTGTEGREQALYGAYLSAVAFASAGSGLHHKICHVLGGTFNLPHAQTHATVLPYVLAFNSPFAADAEARIAAAFGTADALTGLQNLRKRLDAPKALSDYGFTADGIAEAVTVILPAVPASNPRAVTAENLSRLVQAALTGEEPQVLLDL